MPTDNSLQALRRLSQGKCPVHNIVMPQVGMRGARAVVECPVKECEISGTAESSGGEVYLDKKFQDVFR